MTETPLYKSISFFVFVMASIWTHSQTVLEPIEDYYDGHQFYDMILVGEQCWFAIASPEFDLEILVQDLNGGLAVDQMSLDLENDLGELEILAANWVEADDFLTLLVTAQIDDSESLTLVHVGVSPDLEAGTPLALSIPNTENVLLTHTKAQALSDASFVLAGIDVNDANFPLRLFKLSNSFQLVSSATLDQDWFVPEIYTGFYLNELAGEIHLGGMSGSSILDLDLGLVSDYNFNWGTELGSDVWRSFVFGASAILGENLVVQSSAFLDLLESEKRDNLLWVIDSSGSVQDTLFIPRPMLEEVSVGKTISSNSQGCFLGSTFEEEFDSAIAKGDGIYFTSLNENLEVTWELSYANPDRSYTLLQCEVNDNCAVGLAIENLIDEGVPHQRLLVFKFDAVHINLNVSEEFVDLESLAFPNPARHELRISDTQNRIHEVRIYGMTGQAIECEWRQEDSTLIVDSSILSAGNYIITLLGEGQTIRKRFTIE